MKRKHTFKAVKYGIRGAFFTVFFTIKMLSKFVKYLQRIKTEALSGMGSCPNCKSLDLDYEEPTVSTTKATYNFRCCKCGKLGKEVYGLRYITSLLKKEEDDEASDARAVREATPDSPRATETDKPVD